MYKKYLETKAIYLRELRESDVTDEYYNWLNDPDINKFLETRYHPRSKKDILEFVNKMDGNPDEIIFAICYKGNDKHIGNIKLGPINWIHRRADISLLIGDKDYWGKGMATEAINAVANFAFRVLNLQKITAGYYEKNIGSSKVFEKCGFVREGHFKNECFYNGAYINVIRVGLVKEDYQKINV